MECDLEIDTERVIYAFREYSQSIERYSLLLDSSNPDHYKRAGALLHALYSSKVITAITPVYDRQEIANGVAMIHLHEEGKAFEALDFYETYYNFLHAFDIAYRACAAYEKVPVEYDFDYLHNVCFFMYKNSAISVDTFFMIFKSLMVSNAVSG